MKKFIESRLACSFFIALLIIVVALINFSGRSVLYGPDADDVLVPMFFDISREISEHGIFSGMYNSGLVAGLSYWGSPSFHPLYPFYFNWLGSDLSIEDTLDRLKLVFILHMAIYGVGSYFVGRSLGVRRLLAISVGVSAPFFASFQSVSVWPPISASLAWIPWVMLFQINIYRRGWSPGSAVALAASVIFLIYAQPAQNLVLSFIGSCLFGVACTILIFNRYGLSRGFIKLRPIFYSLAFAAIVVLVFCYPYLSGVIDFHNDSIRWLGDGRDISGKEKLPFSALTAHALRWDGIFSLFFYSSRFTQVVGNLYFGLPLVMACAIFPFVFRRNHLILALLLSVAVSASFCFVYFSWLLYHIPVANKVREVNWWSCYVVAIGLPVGALCMQRLIASARGLSSSFRFALIWLFPVLMSFAGFAFLRESVWQMVFVAAAMFFLYASTFFRGVVSVAGMAIVVLFCALIPFVFIKFPPLGQTGILRTERIEQRHEMEAVFNVLHDAGNYRIKVSESFTDFKVLTHQLSNLGARGVRGDLNPQRRSKFDLLYFPSPAISRLYGVRYQLVPVDTEGSIHVYGKYALIEDGFALPRVFLATAGLKSVDNPVAELQGYRGDMVESIFIRPGDISRMGLNGGELFEGVFSPVAVRVTKNSSVLVELIAETHGPALIVLNEDVEGRWYAIVDGEVQHGVSVNGFQTAFAIRSAGKHSVVIRRPSSLLNMLADVPAGRGELF